MSNPTIYGISHFVSFKRVDTNDTMMMKGGFNMNQIKMGSFLKELRLEKRLTQEQLAEQLNVSNRSISRWETGNTLPDISLLIELAEFYDVEIKEIIDGERKSENMDQKEKDTLLKVADYAENEKDILMKRVRIISFVGLGSLLLALLFVSFEIEQINPFLMCIEGIAFGLSVGALITCIFFTTGVLSEIRNNKKSKCVVTALRVIFTAIVIICIMVCLIMTVLNK